MPEKRSRSVYLYFFPALLPLASILPWLLTTVAALAGATQVRRRTKLGVVALVCFGAAGALWGWRYFHSPNEQQGSRLIPQTEWSRLERLSDGGAKGDGQWFQLTTRKALSTPVFANKLALLGTHEATLDAFSLANGELLWSLHKHEPVLAVTVAGNRAYVGEGLHTAVTSTLTAISLPGGNPLWERQFLGHIEMAPLVRENQLWVSTGPQGLWSLDTRNGDVLWRAKIGHVDCTPLLLDGMLIVPAQPDDAKKEIIVYALRPESGKKIWERKLQGQPWGSPLAAQSGSRILLTTAIGQVGPRVATDRGWAHALTAKTGELAWSVELSGMPLPASTVFDARGLVYHSLKSGAVVALKIQDGATAWSAKIGDEMHASATLFADAEAPEVAAVSLEGNLSIRDALTGVEQWHVDAGPGGSSSPAYFEGQLYLATPGRFGVYRQKE